MKTSVAQLPATDHRKFYIPQQVNPQIEKLINSQITSSVHQESVNAYPKDVYINPSAANWRKELVDTLYTDKPHQYARYLSEPNVYETTPCDYNMYREVDLKTDALERHRAKHSRLPGIPIKEPLPQNKKDLTREEFSDLSFTNSIGYVTDLRTGQKEPSLNINNYIPACTVPPRMIAPYQNIDNKNDVKFNAKTRSKEVRTQNGFSINMNQKEGFKGDNPAIEIADETYIRTLEARARCMCHYLLHDRKYAPWTENWNFLRENLCRGKDFSQLRVDDGDIAFVIDKGNQKNFRIRGTDGYVPLNVYQYVLYHEMSHMSTHELQHTPGFYKLLNILCAAAFEQGFIDLRRYTEDYYKTNNQPIASKDTMIDEIIMGFKYIKEANQNDDDICEYCNKMMSVVGKMTGVTPNYD